MTWRWLAAWLLLLAAPAAAAPALWVVKDGDTEITLFGTIHELPAATQWLTPRIASRFDAADSLVVEVDVPDDPVVLASAVSRAGIVPGLPPLASRVPLDRRSDLLKAVAEAKLPLAALDNMKTWLAAITLSDAFVDATGFSAENGVDTTLLARARAAAKPIVPLETIDQQLGFFDGLPETEQRALLAAVLADRGSAKADADELVTAWLAGDTDALAILKDKDMRASPALAAALVTQRNARWAKWIEGVMQRPGKVFVAVGAGHLAGPDSVIDLLTKAGLTVERVP